MKKLVSLIVTVFNKQDTIQKCLNSIKKQSYVKIEVLVIDDGSTDNSSKIARKVCEADNRFKYYYQRNNGVSSARNLGLYKAKGDFVLFIDGDDFIDSNYVEKIMRYSNYDIVVSGYKRLRENDIVAEVIRPQNIDFSIDSLNIFFSEDTFKFIGVPYSKLFKLSIIKKNKLKFDVEKDFGEDTEFVFKYLLKCRTVKYISYSGYNDCIYLTNTLSRKNRSNVWEVNRDLVNALKLDINCNYDKNWTFLYMRAISLSLRASVNNAKLFREVWKKVRRDKQFKKIRVKNIESNSKKILYLLLRINAVSIAYNIYNKKMSKSNF